MNFEILTLDDLAKADRLPNIVHEQTEETWFVRYGEDIIGVGLFLPDSEHCVLAMVGNSETDKQQLGTYGSSDPHAKAITDALQLAFETYLRSVKGDTVIGSLPIEEQ
ncbi:hypothetical protein [Sphingobacterium suaedae]|uniref:Uncharacterized protein n=1 Tax=Sphingobacterium suaedae TaxID=1686402 RepID=A0ABW5KFE6_9SPHI